MSSDKIDESLGVLLPIVGKTLQTVNTVVIPVLLNNCTASSVYLSKSVSKMPWYWKCNPDPTSKSTQRK